MVTHGKTNGTRELTLKDRLSRLTYQQACKLLGGDEAIIVTKSRKATNLAPVEGRLSGRTSRSVGAYKTR
ncbi:MAG: hypothetical protein ACE5E5_14950 [Phycisphaerae bacterium]